MSHFIFNFIFKCLEGGTYYAKKMKTRIYAAPAVKGWRCYVITLR